MSEPKKKAKRKMRTTPSFALANRDVDRQFCGGGAWTSLSDYAIGWHNIFEILRPWNILCHPLRETWLPRNVGMFRRSASLALPHLKSFAAIPSVSPVQLGHTNRSVFLSHESQREIALVLALSRPSPYYQQGEVGEEKWACVSQRLCF